MVLQVDRRSSSPPHPQPSSCAGWIMLWSAREGWISACVSDRERKSAGKGVFVFKVCRCVCEGGKGGSIMFIDSSYPGWRLTQGFPRDSYSGPSRCWQKGLMGCSDRPICRDMNMTHMAAHLLSISPLSWSLPPWNTWNSLLRKRHFFLKNAIY